MSSDPQTTRTFLEALQGVLMQVAEPSQVLRTIMDRAVAQTGADRGMFVEVASDGALDYQVLHRYEKDDLSGQKGQFSRNLFALVVEHGKGVRLRSAMEDLGDKGSAMDSVMVLRLQAVLCMPILSGGRVAALVYLEHQTPGHFRAEHQESLNSLINVATPVYEALRASREVLRDRHRLEEADESQRQELSESREVLTRDWSFGRFVGKSVAVRELGDMVRKAANSDFPVLVTGETGTGKSILSRVIHHSGPRAQKPFVTVFCPSLNREMVEAELFGHKRGTFTGAVTDRTGKVQAAEGGTLFLDEIGELPMEMQPKLLRLLQERTYERVGDTEERKSNVRVIAATNRDLEQEVDKGRFRRDLFARLNFIPVRIPPLRERKEDLPLLLRNALDKEDAGRWVEISKDAQGYLVDLDFAWPGNVRHIEQLAARLLLETRSAPVSRDELFRTLGSDLKHPPVAETTGAAVGDRAGSAPARLPVEAGIPFDKGLPALLEEQEKAWLIEVMAMYPHDTRAQMAARLKISESGLYKKLKAYGLSA